MLFTGSFNCPVALRAGLQASTVYTRPGKSTGRWSITGSGDRYQDVHHPITTFEIFYRVVGEHERLQFLHSIAKVFEPNVKLQLKTNTTEKQVLQ